MSTPAAAAGFKPLVSARTNAISSAGPTSALLADTVASGALKQNNAAADAPSPKHAGGATVQKSSVGTDSRCLPWPLAPDPLLTATRGLAVLNQAGAAPAQLAAGSGDSILGKHPPPSGIMQQQPKRFKNQLPGLADPSLNVLNADEGNHQGTAVPDGSHPAHGPLQSLVAESDAMEGSPEGVDLEPHCLLLNLLPANQGFQPIALLDSSSWDQLTQLP